MISRVILFTVLTKKIPKRILRKIHKKTIIKLLITTKWKLLMQGLIMKTLINHHFLSKTKPIIHYLFKKKMQEKEKKNEHTKKEYVELEKFISHHVPAC